MSYAVGRSTPSLPLTFLSWWIALASLQFGECSEDTAIQTDPPTLEEIRRAISKLKYGRASGWDNIAQEMLRCASEPFARGLHVLFQKVWETGRVQADWKDGVIIPL